MGWVTWLRAGSGNTMIAFALGAVPLSIVTGLTIDSGRISASRFEAEAALSAAVWSMASEREADPFLARQRFLDHQPKGSVFTLRSLDFTIDGTGTVEGTASIAPPLGFMTFAGWAPEEIVIRVRAPRSVEAAASDLAPEPLALAVREHPIMRR